MSSYIKDDNSQRMDSLNLSISTSNLQNLQQILKNINNFDFNIFQLDEIAEKQTLYYLTYEIFINMNFLGKDRIDADKFRNFIYSISEGYDRNIPYHNDIHAGDVLQTSYLMINNVQLIKDLSLNDIDLISILFAALAHDFRHPGKNNLYQINAKTDLALTYNDSSVLENYHVSEVFKLLVKDENCILEKFSPEEFRIFRRRMIECILSTYMANHSKTIGSVKNKLETFEINKGKNLDKMIFFDNLVKTYENQQTILNLIIHTADISNPCKPASVNKIWVDLLFVEFFSQGDAERAQNLPLSHLCDRYKTDVNQSQIVFINCIVAPTLETLLRVNPEVEAYLKILKENLVRYEKTLS